MNRRLVTAISALTLCHCSGGDADRDPNPAEEPDPSWLDNPEEMPPTLEDTGLYPDLGDLTRYHRRAILYRPELALWSNGSHKQRFIVLPRGERVDTSERDAWEFPENTLFFKTFSYEDSAAEDGLRPIETRVLKKTSDGWEYHAYLWGEDRDTAELLDGIYTTPVSVEHDGESFEHVVPARLDCRACHESQPVRVIGFDELRLNAPLDPGDDTKTQLEALAEAGVLGEPPEEPAVVAHDDATTQQVLGYFQGNCVHCHNGWDGPSSAFDMRYTVALENLIGVDTTSELLRGVRIVPGSAMDSALYKALTRDPDLDDTQAMPPVGVDRVDAEAVELVGGWIDGLDPDDYD